MKNCLFTKLKGVVDNDNLLYLNKVRVFMKNNTNIGINQNTFKVTVSEQCTIRSKNGENIIGINLNDPNISVDSRYVNTYILPIGTTEVTLNGTFTSDAYVFLENAKAITKIAHRDTAENHNYYFLLDELSNLPNLREIDFPYGFTSKGTWNKKYNQPLEKMVASCVTYGSGVTIENGIVNVENLPSTVNTLDLSNVTNACGDFMNLINRQHNEGKNILTTLKFINTSVTGNISDYIDILAAHSILAARIQANSLIKYGEKSLNNNIFDIESQDNGTTYTLKNDNILWGTYTVATRSWIYNI